MFQPAIAIRWKVLLLLAALGVGTMSVGAGGCEFPIASVQQLIRPQTVTDSGVG